MVQNQILLKTDLARAKPSVIYTHVPTINGREIALKTLGDYIDLLNEQDERPAVLGKDDLGNKQRDPDKPNKTVDLIASLKEIIEIAQRAMNSHKDEGLGDKTRDSAHDDLDKGDFISKAKADSSAELFGQE